jgi:hypothetical protein
LCSDNWTGGNEIGMVQFEFWAYKLETSKTPLSSKTKMAFSTKWQYELIESFNGFNFCESGWWVTQVGKALFFPEVCILESQLDNKSLWQLIF